MTTLAIIPVLFGDIFVNGMAAGSLGFVAYLWWLGFREKRSQRAERDELDRRRREYSGEP